MIKPHKYLDFNSSTLVIGARILSILLKHPKINYMSLLDKLIVDSDDNIKIVFPESLSFLYLIGKVEYNQITDEVELIL